MADYLQKRNKPNAGFALIGIAWSMGMAIGLHREFGPLGTHTSRQDSLVSETKALLRASVFSAATARPTLCLNFSC